MPLGLIDLPFEILNHIVENFDDVQTIVSFSRLSKRFNQYAKLDGYRVFIFKQHPCYQKAGSWIDAIRTITSLSRAWTRKAFIARNLRPPNSGHELIRLPEDQTSIATLRSYGRQSMGYQPVIDCYESSLNGSSHEVLTWGAGAELIIRLKRERLQSYAEITGKQSRSFIRSSDGTLQWVSYKPKEMLDGRDDITAAKLLRPNQVHDDGKQHVIVGRASGHLQHVIVDQSSVEVQNLGCNTLSIDCADITSSGDPIVAACLDNKKVVLHRLDSLDADNDSTEFEFPSQGRSETIWTMRFLSSRLLATGQGSTTRPLSLLQLTPTGLTEMNFPQIPYNVSDAIYAIEALQDTPHLFLTGHYSGHIQLNDTRIPNGRAAVYDDPVDCSPIYSLLPMTNQIFVAGGARHCLLKFFDMRRPNWSCSSYTIDYDSTSQNGYNIFLPTVGTRMTRTSPTYCLSATSPHATTFYAGIENGIVQMDLHSITDRRAKPRAYIPLLDRLSPNQAQLERETESLRLVEHTTDGVPILLRQTSLGHRNQREQKTLEDYDDRWAEDFGYDSYQSLRRTGRDGRPVNGNMGRRRFS